MKKLFKKLDKVDRKIEIKTVAVTNMLAWKHKTSEDVLMIETDKAVIENLLAKKLELLNKLEDAAGVEIAKLRKQIGEVKECHNEVGKRLSA